MKFNYFPQGNTKEKSAGGGNILKFGDFPYQGNTEEKSAGGGFSEFCNFPQGNTKGESAGGGET